jgi:hypothetical protein
MQKIFPWEGRGNRSDAVQSNHRQADPGSRLMGEQVQRRAFLVIAIAATVVGAFAAGAWIVHSNGDGTDDSRSDVGRRLGPEPSSFDESATLEERIRALEQAVSDERYARQLLQDELFVLTEEMDSLLALRSGTVTVATDVSAPVRSMVVDSRRPTASEGRIAQLVEAGFAPGQAEWIVQRESQLQMEALQARFDAERTGNPMDFFQSRTAASDALRNELGDADYERLLSATGRPSSIAVSHVLESSPAERAGLRPGDQIVSYAGRRIFSMSDLTRETMQGEPGEQVAVDVLRDGVTMQMTLPRGPIGISAGRQFSR